MRQIFLRKDVEQAIALLEAQGFEAFVVGGAVRDTLLNQPVHDYDLTTNATPAEIQSCFQEFRTIPTGIKHGTITVILQKEPLEITTYRKETGYQDHRHPDQVEFSNSLEEDCARRDFTMNALCYSPSVGILDFFEGETDLFEHRIRTVGDPMERFNEDALRILRAVRFCAQFNFQMEPKTSEAVHSLCSTLDWVAKERIQTELLKLLKAPGCVQVLRGYRNVTEVILPPLKEVPEAQWVHMLRNMEESEEDEAVRLAILFEGCGLEGSATALLKGLKFSSTMIQTVTELLRNKKAPVQNRVEVRKLLSKCKVSMRIYVAFRSAIDSTISKKDLMMQIASIQKEEDCISLKQLQLKGNDLQELGYRDARISYALEQALLGVMEDRVINRKENLIAFLKTNGY